MNSKSTLSILQYNTWKSKDGVMLSLPRDERIMGFDILAIQELWRNAHHNTTHHPHKHLFDLVYLDNAETRVCVFINRKIPKARWTAIHHSPDLTIITITTSPGTEENTLYIHNFYNPTTDTGESNIPLLQGVLAAIPGQNHILVGNFNLHHPLWGGESAQRHSEANELIQLMEPDGASPTSGLRRLPTPGKVNGGPCPGYAVGSRT